MATTAISAPIFDRVSSSGQEAYRQFFELTEPQNLSEAMTGPDLSTLAELATQVRTVIHISRMNISDNIQVQDQWQLNQMSEVKRRLATAIQIKRDYYENSFFGIVTKYFLKFFCAWNNGDTVSIVQAEDVLLFWDSRKAVLKISNTTNIAFGKYSERQDYRTSHLDTSQYFNYNPRRLIELSTGEKINYSNL